MLASVSKAGRTGAGRCGPLARLDGRTRTARALRQVRDALIGACGPSPTAAQIELAQLGASLRLQLLQLDGCAANAGLTSAQAKTYVSLSGAYARLLRQLTLLSRTRAAHMPSSTASTALGEHLRRRIAERGEVRQ